MQLLPLVAWAIHFGHSAAKRGYSLIPPVPPKDVIEKKE